MPKDAPSFIVAVSLALLGPSPARADSPSPPYQLPPECKAVPVRSVDHVSIEPGTPPKIVATGTVPAAGWKDPQLRFRSITRLRSRDASALYAFVACPPDAGTEVLTPITAATILNLSPQLGRVYHLVVEAATNSATLELEAPPKH